MIFIRVLKEKFIPNAVKEYFVFTDSKDLFDCQNNRVHLIKQENLGWPGNTLFRFRMFLTQKENLKQFDYIFFINANVVCVEKVGEEFLPIQESLLFVQHPGFIISLITVSHMIGIKSHQLIFLMEKAQFMYAVVLMGEKVKHFCICARY